MDKEAIREELNKVREEIKSLKSVFLKHKDQKEAHFSEGEKYSSEIDSILKEIKKIEEENHLDKINEDLEEKKKVYDELQEKISAAEEELKKIRSSSIRKPGLENKPFDKRISVDKAQKEIKKLELTLQTQVLSLDKESQLIKKVDELKDIINSKSPKKMEVSDDFSKAKKELRKLQRKFVASEKSIRSLYKQIRLVSKEKKKKYKLIDDLRDQKKKAFDDFRSKKKEYSKVGKDLKSLFKKEEELMVGLGEERPAAKRRTSNDKEIKVKQKELEEKLMKKGGTLTTEDLLMFQTKK